MKKVVFLLFLMMSLTACQSLRTYKERFDPAPAIPELVSAPDDATQVSVSLRSLRGALLISDLYDALVVNHNADAQIANSIIDAYNASIKRYWQVALVSSSVGATVGVLLALVLGR